ncbi:MAG TPA: hypothetical protein VLM40_04950 [Gemmata sp.]|nr:hypothetical protein [Gemmata sp.]
MDWLRSRATWWVPLAVMLGLALRTYHYARSPAVWHDEAALLLNVIGLSISQMCGPLLHAEAAPPAFLMAERGVALTLGDGIFALRLLPFLASCLALILFASTCRRLLGPLSAALAVGLFAVSDRLLWHSCEAKPYALDVLVAVAAAWWFVRTEGWPLCRRCIPTTLAAPFAIWVSFPACFILGGLIVGLLPAAMRSGWKDRAALAALAFVVGGSFVALALGPVAAQRCSAMESCWTAHFPDWSRPWFAPAWATLQTLEVCRYCLMPIGQVFAVFAGFGVAAMWWRPGGRELVAVLLVPLGLALAAAFLHKYPYGGMRVEAFATPAICLLSTMGMRHVLPRLARKSRAAAFVVTLAAIGPPAALTVYRVIEPWPRAETDVATAFVIEHRQPGEPIFGNYWEHEYYLRDEPTFRPWQGAFEEDEMNAQRAWVVHTSDRAADDYPFPLPRGWEVAARTEFARTSVFELRRRSVTGAPPAP